MYSKNLEKCEPVCNSSNNGQVTNQVSQMVFKVAEENFDELSKIILMLSQIFHTISQAKGLDSLPRCHWPLGNKGSSELCKKI